MGATVNKDGELWVVRITGMLRKAEMDAIQFNAIQELTAETRARVLILAEEFLGWHRQDSWGDVSFIAKHGDRIERIAIVAEPQWEDRFLMFTGAGFRSSEVKFFPLEQVREAREWLARSK
jgi:hypothetical protein